MNDYANGHISQNYFPHRQKEVFKENLKYLKHSSAKEL